MAAAYALVSLVFGAFGVAAIWTVSPVVAIVSAPFFASAGVLGLALTLDMRKRFVTSRLAAAQPGRAG